MLLRDGGAPVLLFFLEGFEPMYTLIIHCVIGREWPSTWVYEGGIGENKNRLDFVYFGVVRKGGRGGRKQT